MKSTWHSAGTATLALALLAGAVAPAMAQDRDGGRRGDRGDRGAPRAQQADQPAPAPAPQVQRPQVQPQRQAPPQGMQNRGDGPRNFNGGGRPDGARPDGGRLDGGRRGGGAERGYAGNEQQREAYQRGPGQREAARLDAGRRQADQRGDGRPGWQDGDRRQGEGRDRPDQRGHDGLAGRDGRPDSRRYGDGRPSGRYQNGVQADGSNDRDRDGRRDGWQGDRGRNDRGGDFGNRQGYGNRPGYGDRQGRGDRLGNRYAGNGRDWNRSWRSDQRYDWNRYRYSNRSAFRLGYYNSPYRDWSYRRLNVGFYLQPLFFSNSYWLSDPYAYRLPPAYGPYRWVRYYDDALLVDIYSGEVVDTVYDIFR